MKILHNERGNTLLIVLLMIVIFSVAGLSLLSTTMNGVKRTSVREADIQVTELAEKGIDFLTAYLETETKPLAGLPVGDFENRMGNIIQTYYVNGENTVPQTAGKLIDEPNKKLKVKIYSRSYLSPGTEDLTQQMTLHSEATVKGKTKTITSTIHLGAKKVPDALKYAVGAYNPCKDAAKCESKKDDGNMFLHGGVAIKGDLYVERNLVTKSTGVVTYANNGYKWIPSDLPSIEGEDGSKARLIVGEKLYKLNNDKLSYNQNINQNTFNRNEYEEIIPSKVSDAFTKYNKDVNKQYSPILDQRVANFAPIEIDAQRSKYYFDSRTVTDLTKLVGNLGSTNAFLTDVKGVKDRIGNEIIEIKNGFSLNRLSFLLKNNQQLHLRGNKLTDSIYNIKNGAYIGGNLTIGETPEYPYDPNNSNNYEKFQIEGPLFVDGNLTIKGANVKFNSTIFVTGSTTINYSKIQGIDKTQVPESSLVVFGKDAIHISNNNVYKDEPNIIRGFFYSEEMMEIYGVGSHLEIQGGIFGRKIVLNATRGTVKENYDWDWSRLQWVSNDIYQLNQPNISPAQSRLKITYNPDLIENPPEGLPKVKDLAVTTVERKIK
ncbi:hypothetical protein IHV12_03875 [Fictibacillus sp. 7GRE50]|uniref:hypothetical protein n=1 Tax=Fictibacillus sp. 7GRE50 TaxID=2745878 RepID=UPI0018CDA8E9|nr:hypothetical protein [Fictibacillus sp. 7GRE50]MBH0164037.1 hypothetical protein [Fictibacillus sp. 7GRE50]